MQIVKTGHLRNIDCVYFYSENNKSCRQKIILLATAFASAMLCKKKYRARLFGTAYGLVAYPFPADDHPSQLHHFHVVHNFLGALKDKITSAFRKK